ncbi:MAG: pyruvate synthase subunit beta [Chloroflexi bacterium]|jgi:pyruvate ferredoxin oxidoreductase beta subunit|nr:pyruvate synthase subunit beta [Chloroflexota bacterium]MBT7080702.1 pyruvate synthase subunit beta [Chloroflexota bacterium]MBT7290272.1 pyruvate synthase subunit beta [Chloroflexota bacterium]
MEKYGLYTPRVAPQKEYFAAGHRACVGCGEMLAVRLVCKALGKETIVINSTGCIEIVSSLFPDTSWEVPWMHTLFENSAAVASGVESAIKVMQRKGKYADGKVNVVAMGGDGATLDIGMQALSGAMERGHDFVYVCYDNEAYMNTGIQRSSATPYGAMTTTSPPGKKSIGQQTWKKDMPAIAVAHNIPYVATASPAYPFDLMEKVKKAAATKGPAYLQIFSPCPTGWRSAGEISVKLARLAVETGAFPLYEVENGKYNLTMDFEKLRPITDYMKPQGRYRHLTESDIVLIEKKLHEQVQELRDKSSR